MTENIPPVQSPWAGDEEIGIRGQTSAGTFWRIYEFDDEGKHWFLFERFYSDGRWLREKSSNKEYIDTMFDKYITNEAPAQEESK